jgi:hypothetical protein
MRVAIAFAAFFGILLCAEAGAQDKGVTFSPKDDSVALAKKIADYAWSKGEATGKDEGYIDGYQDALDGNHKHICELAAKYKRPYPKELCQ